MRIFRGCLGVLLLGLGACSHSSRVADFIPGRYVSSVRTAYAQAADTLLIRRLSGGHYELRRRTVYRPVRKGKLLAPRRRVLVMEAVYDPAGEVLRDTRGGREFRFDPDRRRLMTGRAVYRKLPD